MRGKIGSTLACPRGIIWLDPWPFAGFTAHVCLGIRTAWALGIFFVDLGWAYNLLLGQALIMTTKLFFEISTNTPTLISNFSFFLCVFLHLRPRKSINLLVLYYIIGNMECWKRNAISLYTKHFSSFLFCCSLVDCYVQTWKTSKGFFFRKFV